MLFFPPFMLHLLLLGMECAMGNRFGHVESHGSHMKCRFVPQINYFQSYDLKSWLHSSIHTEPFILLSKERKDPPLFSVKKKVF